MIKGRENVSTRVGRQGVIKGGGGVSTLAGYGARQPWLITRRERVSTRAGSDSVGKGRERVRTLAGYGARQT